MTDRPETPSADPRGELPLQRADRNMLELLQELRVAQTGAQILFGFLLSLSFTQRFTQLDQVQRWTYVVTLLLAAITSALLVAPVTAHRMVFRRGVKPALVLLSHRLALGGLGCLGLTLLGSVLLVLDVTFGTAVATSVSAVLAIFFGALWFVLPLRLRPSGSSPHRVG